MLLKSIRSLVTVVTSTYICVFHFSV